MYKPKKPLEKLLAVLVLTSTMLVGLALLGGTSWFQEKPPRPEFHPYPRRIKEKKPSTLWQRLQDSSFQSTPDSTTHTP